VINAGPALRAILNQLKPGYSQMNEPSLADRISLDGFPASRELEGGSRIQQGNIQPNEIKK